MFGNQTTNVYRKQTVMIYLNPEVKNIVSVIRKSQTKVLLPNVRTFSCGYECGFIISYFNEIMEAEICFLNKLFNVFSDIV